MEFFENIGDALLSIWDSIISVAGNMVSALYIFHNTLADVDATIVDMSSWTSSSIRPGLINSDIPILQAIATLKYLIPDDIFYLIYMIFYISCLFVCFKIISLVIDLFRKVMGLSSSGWSASGMISKVGKFFK